MGAEVVAVPDDAAWAKNSATLLLAAAPLPVVDDKIGSPTYVYDVAQGLLRLLQEDVSGTVHMANAGKPVSRYQLAQHILHHTNLSTPIQPVPSSYFPHLAPRPAMEATISHYTRNWLPRWTTSLAHYLKTFTKK